jgi:hypothetical protein
MGKSMAEFARLIGVADHSIVSKYEAGQVPPGRSVLILLFLLAHGEEKTPLLAALGLDDDGAVRETFGEAEEALLAYDRMAARTRTKASKDAGIREFVKEAAAVAALGVPLDPAVTEVLRRLHSHGASRQIQAQFRNFITYLDIAMPSSGRAAAPKKQENPRRKRSTD